MTRKGGAWIPDGRAKAIRADCEASLEALDGLPIDLYLLHAPDPRTPWRTSVRALARLVDDGLVRRVGVANVNRRQLDEALELAPVAAVQVALSPSTTARSAAGSSSGAPSAGIALIAHSPLGGPTRAGRLARRAELADVAEHAARRPPRSRSRGCSGSRPPWSRSRARAGRRRRARPPALRRSPSSADDRRRSHRAFGAPAAPSRPRAARRRGRARDGHPRARARAASPRSTSPAATSGSTATSAAGPCASSPPRSTRSSPSGARRVVLDNTYLTRASRSYVLEAAGRHGSPVRCVWLDTPLAQAQVNLVERLLERFGALPAPEELRSRARGTRACSRRRRRCARCASSSRRRPTRGSRRGAGAFARAPRGGPRRRLRRGRRLDSRAGRTRSRTRAHRTSSSTGTRPSARRGSPPSRHASRPSSRARSRARSAPTPAARRRAGAARRSRASRSLSRGLTRSTRRARPSSGRARHTGRSRRPSAPGTCRQVPSTARRARRRGAPSAARPRGRSARTRRRSRGRGHPPR